DYFSSDGQLWGNPIYDWDALRRDGFRWSIARLRALLAHVDVVRLDHFLAFSAAWHIPAGAPTARAGHWVSGPGAEFFSTLQRELGALPFIAEDLGVVTPEVRALRDQFHIPGTRVLQFAFDGAADNPHLPTNYVPNTVVYTGTHDNATTRGRFEGLPDAEQQHVWSYLKRPTGRTDEASWELIGLAWASRAALAMVPLQDVLNLGAEARMNVPGHAEGNWSWRCTEGMLDSHAFQRLPELTTASHRPPPLGSLGYNDAPMPRRAHFHPSQPRLHTRDGVPLDGVIREPTRRRRAALIWVHGLGSTFASGQPLIEVLSRRLNRVGVAYLKFSNRGHDIVVRGGRRLQGSAFERFTECVEDIRTTIAFARRAGYRTIILAGTSTGANKVLHYAARTRDRRVRGLILLGPVSDIAGEMKEIGPAELRRRVTIAERLAARDPDGLVPTAFGF